MRMLWVFDRDDGDAVVYINAERVRAVKGAFADGVTRIDLGAGDWVDTDEDMASVAGRIQAACDDEDPPREYSGETVVCAGGEPVFMRGVRLEDAEADLEDFGEGGLLNGKGRFRYGISVPEVPTDWSCKCARRFILATDSLEEANRWVDRREEALCNEEGDGEDGE